MAYENLIYEKKGHIAIITGNRPAAMNANNLGMTREKRLAFLDFENDPDLWVCIYTGAGERAFCAGGDLKERAQNYEDFLERRKHPNPLMNPGHLTKPVIAAVNGFAHGGGFEEALSCDVIIAADHANFRLPEPLRGFLPGSGMFWLPRSIPYKKAMGILLTAKAVSAQEAYELGFVNEVVPLKDLMGTATRWANEILELAPLAVKSLKHFVALGMEMPIRGALQLNSSAWVDNTEDAKEGPRAFVEKRKPVWQGR